MSLKKFIDNQLEKEKRSFAWLVREMEMSNDGLKLSLDRETIPLKGLKKLASILNVPISEILDCNVNTGNIYDVPITARAGFLLGYGDQSYKQEELERFSLPEFNQGLYFAFTADGDSMYPTISNGDKLICQPAGIDNLRGNEIYVIATQIEGMTVKRIYPGKKKSEIVLKSDNVEYSDYVLSLTEVQSVFLVKACITKHLGRKVKHDFIVVSDKLTGEMSYDEKFEVIMMSQNKSIKVIKITGEIIEGILADFDINDSSLYDKNDKLKTIDIQDKVGENPKIQKQISDSYRNDLPIEPLIHKDTIQLSDIKTIECTWQIIASK